MQGVHVKGMFVAVVAATRKVKEELNAVLCFSKASRNEAYAIAFAWSLFLALVTPTAFGRDMGGAAQSPFWPIPAATFCQYEGGGPTDA